jgi:glucose-fructose oxidoreductase
MIDAARESGVKLMTAYRLHFERANTRAIEIVRSGKIGEPRIFTAHFTMQVKDPKDIRLHRATGGGTLWDIGIYCLNAARYVFRSEPIEAVAISAKDGDTRWREVEEMASVVLRFPKDRLATFTCSFGAQKTSAYRVIGTRGELQVDPAFHYSEALRHLLTIGDRTRQHHYPRRDQFAPELIYFSRCIRRNIEPEPSGIEGWADVRIIEALYRSIRSGGKRVKLTPIRKARRPSAALEMYRRPTRRRS